MDHFEIRDLTFSYPGSQRKVLDHVSLRIEQGSYLTICGRSGCGKTTLLNHLKTVLRPAGERSGTVLFEGVTLDDVPQRVQNSKIGFVMQNPDSQVVTDKVWHELAFGLESLGCDQRTMRLRVAEMASYFNIQGWFHNDVRSLSGGQKQLLNLASIMAMQPSVLVLDEPTSQLDPIAASDFLNTVRKINRELGTTVILTEHRLEEVFSAADRVVVMRDGKVLCDASPRMVGDALHEQGDEMIAALPAPMRIYYGVMDADARAGAVPFGEGAARPDAGSPGDTASPEGCPDAPDAPDAPGQPAACPMTVREGRAWLSQRYARKAPTITAVADDEVLEEAVRDPAVRLKDVWFRYGRDLPDVVRGASFEVPKGSFFAIVGGNGTGKSTTMKIVCGAERPYRGRVEVLGQKLEGPKGGDAFRRNVSMLPQDPQNLFCKENVRDDLLDMLDGAGLSREQALERVGQMARKLGIEPLLDQHPFDLSGGEQQRAALAKLLLAQPQVLLLDEPTKGIDSFFKIQLAQLLHGLRDEGRTIIMVSHDVEFCAQHADIVSMFFDGSIVTTNTPRRFFSWNSFYTTAANRMSRHLFQNTITDKDVVSLCRQNPR